MASMLDGFEETKQAIFKAICESFGIPPHLVYAIRPPGTTLAELEREALALPDHVVTKE